MNVKNATQSPSKSEKVNVTVLLPTLNEETAIAYTIQEVRGSVPGCKIIVIDGCSRDRTVEIARAHGAEVMLVPKRGKGIAIREALDRIRGDSAIDAIVMLDGDFTYPAQYILKITSLLDSGRDVVMGYRQTRQEGSMTTINLIGNKALSALASILYGRAIYDVCTGLWGFRRRALDRFHLTSPGFTLEADLFSNAIKTGCNIGQIPIHYRARLSGSTAKLRVGHGVEIAWFLVKSRITKRKQSG